MHQSGPDRAHSQCMIHLACATMCEHVFPEAVFELHHSNFLWAMHP